MGRSGSEVIHGENKGSPGEGYYSLSQTPVRGRRGQRCDRRPPRGSAATLAPVATRFELVSVRGLATDTRHIEVVGPWTRGPRDRHGQIHRRLYSRWSLSVGA